MSPIPGNERETMDRAPRAYIIDAMAVVQCMKKKPNMTTILHLKTAFNARIERMVIGYMEVRVVFDRYVEWSLKETTRKKRATYVAAARWHVNQCDILETTAIVHIHEGPSNLLPWPMPLETV